MNLQSKTIPLLFDKSKIPADYPYFYSIYFIKTNILSHNESKDFVSNLAKILNKSKSRVEQLMYQKKDVEQHDLRGRQLKKIADHLNIPVDDLYTDIKEVRL